jgi:murein DD-endopeptidase MepM/ murein hydrolase activator NlpD
MLERRRSILPALLLLSFFLPMPGGAAAEPASVAVEDPAWVPERPPIASPSASGSAPLAYPTIRFRWPLRKQDWFHTVNYVDLDPAASSWSDWNCATVSYDGHSGNDLILRDFTEQDQGRWVLAAADGVVEYHVDGYFDRNTFPTGRSNYVLVDHADGTRSWYYHLKKRSQLVTVGQQVFEGQPLGQVGSSGPSSWPHLHFEVDDGTSIHEPYSGACQPGASIWQPPQRPHVSAGTPVLYDSAVRLTPPAFADIVERPASTTHVRQNGNTPVYYWVKMSDVHNGDTWNVTFKRPNGTVATTFGNTFTAFDPNPWFWVTHTLPSAGSTGTWTIEWRLNGVLQTPVTTFTYDTVPYQSPVATGRTVAVAKGSAAGDLRGSDADGGLQTFQVSTPPANGELVLSGPRNTLFAYTPRAGFSGNDTFQIQALDSQGALSTAATMTMSVTPNVGNALRLEDDGDYVAVPYSSSLDFTGPFTIEAWIRRDRGSAEWQRIFDRRQPGGSTDSFGYSLHLLWDNHLYFSIGTGTAGWYAYGSTAIPLRQWTHVAVTWDGTTIRLYVDGKEEAFPSFFPGPVSYSGVGEARIGGSHYSTVEDCFRGEIQDVRVWSVARTAAELQSGVGCAFLEGALPATVRGRWKLQGNANDSSSFGNHGTLVSGASFVTTGSGVPTTCAGLDTDADGTMDGSDRCPLTAGVPQTDTDLDGIGDACDACPLQKDPKQPDSDGDRIGDRCDSCPFLGNTEQADADLDGSGDLCDPAPGSSSVGVPSAAITMSLAHSKTTGITTISWNAEGLSSSYEVFRATAPMIRAGFYGTCQNTRDAVVTDTTFAEDQAPAPGEVYHYLTLGVSSSGARGRAGTDSDGRERDLRAGDCL